MSLTLYQRAYRFYLKGNFRKAEDCCKLSISNNLNDYESYNILGVIAIDAKKFGLAHTYLKKALEINNSYAEGYHNLGVLYMKNQLHEDAKVCFLKAIEVNPYYAEPCYNLGWLLSKEKQYKQSLYYYNLAINNKPDYAMAYNNIGHIIATSDVHKAGECFKKAMEINPLLPEAHINMLWVLYYTHGSEGWKDSVEKCLKLPSLTPIQISYVETLLGIYKWLSDNVGEYKDVLEKARKALWLNVIDLDSRDRQTHNMFKDILAYNIFLVKLIEWYKNKNSNVAVKCEGNAALHFIGESHSLTCANKVIQIGAEKYLCKVGLVPACKIWHLINEENNKYKIAFYRELALIPKNTMLVITFGEVDCRVDSGIFKRYIDGKAEWRFGVDFLVSNYFNKILLTLKDSGLIPLVWGIPAPGKEEVCKLAKKYQKEYLEFIVYVNQQLKLYSSINNIKFIDNYILTNDGTGQSLQDSKLDPFHLNPDVFIKSLQSAVLENNVI